MEQQSLPENNDHHEDAATNEVLRRLVTEFYAKETGMLMPDFQVELLPGGFPPHHENN